MVGDLQQTIVALSSAAGPGGRAIVRLSGSEALPVVQTLFAPDEPIPPGPRRFHPGQLRLRDVAAPLPADLYLWPGPRSYTGQDVVELHTLSCPPLVEVLISQLLDAGARAARPGEFTLRAFLAGKLDLTRAEAVLAVIEAGNRDELRQALAQLAGGVSRPLQDLRDDLLNLLADVEAGLDFADEDIQFVARDQLLHRLARGLAQFTLLQKQLDQRALSDRPFRVVLVGRPNAGKSSLFNALTGAAALVSPEPGTTRDYLVGRVTWDGTRIDLIDTAGWKPTNGSIEEQAQLLSHDQADQADLLLLCIEADRGPNPKEMEVLAQPGPPRVLALATKADLVATPPDRVPVSALSGAGLADLKHQLADAARGHGRPALAPSLSRCRHHVEACLAHLRQAHAVVLYEEPPELLALELHGALDQLGEMVGAIYTEDLLDRIFSRFCIGK
jgi:tRNA modification GTPase